LAEVVIIRDPKGYAQPVIAVNDGMSMDWQAWWHLTADMPHLNQAIILEWGEIPRTATMKVQRLALSQQIFS